jgi:ABC-2 type transport system permease protein
VVGVGTFVRLKLRVLGNNLRGQRRQTALFAIGAVVGLLYAVIAGLLLVASAAGPEPAGLVIASGFGGTIVIAWIVMPVLFTGVDETLDPTRFALFPIPRRRLVTGLLVAACVGVPPVATALAFSGAVVGAGLRGGPAAALAGLVGAVLTFAFCVAGSRALTSALAGLLRRRRTRDLTSVIVAILAASISPLQFAGSRVLASGQVGDHAGVSRAIGWSPLTAGFAAPYDVIDGRPLLALGRLGVLAASIALAVWWWSRTLEGAMVGAVSSGSAPARAATGGAVAGLVGRFLPGRPGPFQAMVAREWRYWRRDPRRRAGLISVAMFGVLMPVFFQIVGRHGDSYFGPPPELSAVMAGVLGGVTLMQVFPFDGTAYAAHLLAGVRGRAEMAARVFALGAVVVPIVVVATVAVGVWTSTLHRTPAVVGTFVGTFGVAAGVAAIMSVDAAYPLPDSRNVFALGTGGGTARSLMSLGTLLITAILCAPLFLADVVAPAWLCLAAGLLWGGAGVVAGVFAGGRRLAARGPELLLAVTPRR